jgi:hypothetical protein
VVREGVQGDSGGEQVGQWRSRNGEEATCGQALADEPVDSRSGGGLLHVSIK